MHSWIFVVAQSNIFMILMESSKSVVSPIHSRSSLEKLILHDRETQCSRFCRVFLVGIKKFRQYESYLRHKTITSQSVSSEVQVKNFFILFQKKRYVPFSRYSSFCSFNHPFYYSILSLFLTCCSFLSSFSLAVFIKI